MKRLGELVRILKQNPALVAIAAVLCFVTYFVGYYQGSESGALAGAKAGIIYGAKVQEKKDVEQVEQFFGGKK
jgi:outer membrane lipoprotein SlyB